MKLLNYILDIKDGDEQFFRLDPMLQAVFMQAAAFAWGTLGRRLLITSIERDSGVHGDHRGIDADVCDKKYYHGGVTPDNAAQITNHINYFFKYDLKRPDMNVAIYGDLDPKGNHWNHIHFQVCWGDRTKYISYLVN